MFLAVQKQKWLTSMSYSNDSSTNPITIAYVLKVFQLNKTHHRIVYSMMF